jgi:hypothetical protein
VKGECSRLRAENEKLHSAVGLLKKELAAAVCGLRDTKAELQAARDEHKRWMEAILPAVRAEDAKGYELVQRDVESYICAKFPEFDWDKMMAELYP